MNGGRRKNSKSLHFAPRTRRRAPLRATAVVLVLVVLVAAAWLAKAETAGPPALTTQRLLPSTEVLPGPAPKPAWPSSGEAAVEVEGLPSLGTSGPTKPVPIASLAKIMTAYVVLQDHPLGPGQPGFTIAVTPADVTDYQRRLAQSQSVVPVAAGETLDETQLLQGLLVASGNNFATVLANHDAPSDAAFVAKMQSTARELGMANTTYTDPSGLAPSTESTAGDQLILAAKAMAIPAFAQTVALRSVTLPVAGTVTNFNKAVGTGGYVGIKTGSDSSSGGCLVFANRQNVGGRTFTILGDVLGQAPGQQSTAALVAAAISASSTLIHSVASGVSVKTVVPAGTEVAVVTNPQGKRVAVATTSDLTVMGYGGTTIPLTVSLQNVGTKLDAGQSVGAVSIDGESTVARAVSTMPPVSLGWKLLHDY